MTVRFYRLIPSDTTFRIPIKFIMKCGDQIPNPFLLKTPDGKRWNVRWVEKEDCFWFENGWKDFAEHYSIALGYMLWLEYHENTKHFEAQIFDNSHLEIEYPLKLTDSDSVGISDEVLQSKNASSKSAMAYNPSKKLRTNTSEDVGTSRKRTKNVLAKEDVSGSIESEKEELHKNPSFRVVLTPTCVERYLHVPLPFAEEHFKEENSSVLLQILDGRSWASKYYQGRFSEGWKKFVLDNNLKVGYACVFELTDSEDLTFKVQIDRRGDDETHSPRPQGKKKRISKKDVFTTEAVNFTSEKPFFKFKMAPSNRPCVPISFNMKHFRKMQQFVKLQVGENIWKVLLLCKSDPSELSSRLSRGWAKFAKDNDLQTGDECVFELSKKEGVRLYVHIFRGKNRQTI